MIPLLDTHQHLIYRDRFGYGWTDGIAALDGGFTEDDYSALAAEAGIADAIFMEAAVDEGQAEDEGRFVRDLARAPGNLTRAVIAACFPERDEGFDAWLDETSADPLYVGFRRILHVVDDAVSTSVTFRTNVRKIGARGRVFDLCFLQRQLGIAYDLAAACDDTVMVLDHCGVPDIAGGDFDGWRAAIDRLASLPHVNCKVSGVLAYCGPDQDGETAVRPYVEHVIRAFGWDRVVWGGDWPVVNMASTLPDWAAITRRIVAGEDEGNQAKLFHLNARRIYGL